ncbi:MAG: DUF3667 domain-containing protein [Bacteroidota bacterium]
MPDVSPPGAELPDAHDTDPHAAEAELPNVVEPTDDAPIPQPPPADPNSPERRALEAEPSTRCLNCGASLPGAYCPQCGQKDQPLRTPIHRFVVDTLAEYLGLDGRVWPTLWTLMLKPGRLTQAYVLGRRQQYIRPLRIYLTASVLFFLLLRLIDPLGRINADSGSSRDLADDTTMTAGAYLVRLDSLLEVEAEEDRRQLELIGSLTTRLDSAEQAFIADTTAGRLADPDSLNDARSALGDLQEEVEDEQDDYERMRGSTDDRRLVWRREQAASYRADSMIRPADLVLASQLAVDGDENDGPNFNGPQWLVGGEHLERLQRARTGKEQAEAGIAFGRAVIRYLPTVIFLLLPVYALLLKILYVRRGWYYAEHLVFGLHTHAFAFTLFSLFAVTFWLSGDAMWSLAVFGVSVWVIPVHFILSMKRVYAQGWIKTLVKVYFLAWMYFFVLLFGTLVAAALAAAIG